MVENLFKQDFQNSLPTVERLALHTYNETIVEISHKMRTPLCTGQDSFD